jgi:hypothetical protein
MQLSYVFEEKLWNLILIRIGLYSTYLACDSNSWLTAIYELEQPACNDDAEFDSYMFWV